MFWREKSKKNNVMALTLLASMVALSACGQSNNSGANSSPSETPSETSVQEVSAPASTKLVLYTALSEDDTAALSKKFKEDTGVDVEYLALGSAGDATTRIQAEKDAPQADVLIGGSVEFYQPLEDQGILEKYTSSNASQLDAKFNDPNGYWQGWYMGVLGIVLNKERFDKEIAPKGVQEPTSWDDLLDSNYKNQMIYPNPATTGGGYIFTADQLFRLGDEKGWDYLTKLNNNVHHYTPKSGDTINLIGTGEFTIGVNWAHDIVKNIQNGLPLKVIVPDQTAFEVGGAGIIKGGANTENAKKFMDWLLTKEIGEFNTQLTNRYSVRTDVAPPQGMIPLEQVNLVDYDRTKATEMKEEVVKKFTDMTGNK